VKMGVFSLPIVNSEGNDPPQARHRSVHKHSGRSLLPTRLFLGHVGVNRNS